MRLSSDLYPSLPSAQGASEQRKLMCCVLPPQRCRSRRRLIRGTISHLDPAPLPSGLASIPSIEYGVEALQNAGSVAGIGASLRCSLISNGRSPVHRRN
jgi:hypothetical protein